jgi:hypothetical protein
VRKIISMLPHNKYENIIVIIYNIKVLSTMTLTLVNGKLVAFEMSCNMGQEEDTSPRKVITLTCDEHKIKGKKQVETSSSSSSEQEGEEDDDQVFTSSSNIDDGTIKQIEKVMKMIHNMNLMGVLTQARDI